MKTLSPPGLETAAVARKLPSNTQRLWRGRKKKKKKLNCSSEDLATKIDHRWFSHELLVLSSEASWSSLSTLLSHIAASFSNLNMSELKCKCFCCSFRFQVHWALFCDHFIAPARVSHVACQYSRRAMHLGHLLCNRSFKMRIIHSCFPIDIKFRESSQLLFLWQRPFNTKEEKKKVEDYNH